MRTLIKQRLRRGVQEVRCDPLPHSADPRVQSRRKDRRSISDVSVRCLHGDLQYRRHPGHLIPCGFTSGEKPLPIGLQLLGPAFSEEQLLRAARMYERATDWHTRRPVL